MREGNASNTRRVINTVFVPRRRYGISRWAVADEAPRILPNQLRFFPSLDGAAPEKTLCVESEIPGGDFMKTGFERFGEGIGTIGRGF